MAASEDGGAVGAESLAHARSNTMIPTSTAQFGAETAPAGSLQRRRHVFTDRLAADGFDGYPAMPARWHLYVSPTCP